MSGPIYSLAFSPDGTLVAAGGRPSEVKVYKTADATPASDAVATLKGFTGSVHSLAWHPKGGQLAVAGFDGSVHLYAMPAGTLVKSFVPVPMNGRVTQAR